MLLYLNLYYSEGETDNKTQTEMDYPIYPFCPQFQLSVPPGVGVCMSDVNDMTPCLVTD